MLGSVNHDPHLHGTITKEVPGKGAIVTLDEPDNGRKFVTINDMTKGRVAVRNLHDGKLATNARVVVMRSIEGPDSYSALEIAPE